MPISQYSGRMQIMNLQDFLSKLTDAARVEGHGWWCLYPFLSYVIVLVMVVTFQWNFLSFLQIHLQCLHPLSHAVYDKKLTQCKVVTSTG